MPLDLETLVLLGIAVAAVSATVATFQEVDDAAGYDDVGPPPSKRTRMQYGRPDYWDNEWGKMLKGPLGFLRWCTETSEDGDESPRLRESSEVPARGIFLWGRIGLKRSMLGSTGYVSRFQPP